jgi:hypothetical protein
LRGLTRARRGALRSRESRGGAADTPAAATRWNDAPALLVTERKLTRKVAFTVQSVIGAPR